MITAALSLLAGISLVQFLPVLPHELWLILGSIGAGIIAWLRYWRLFFFVAGLLWAVVFAMLQLADRLPENLEGVEIPVTGVIASLSSVDERRVGFDFIVTRSAQPLPSKLKLSWYNTG